MTVFENESENINVNVCEGNDDSFVGSGERNRSTKERIN